MGFSLVIQAMIEAKKPIIGHNCMYDWLYLYNQFIAPLPETYLQFAQEWNSRFPFTYDTKVLAYNSKAFYNTSLGQVYEKCTNDDKFKNNLRWRFDTKNHCSNYEGQALLSHYHEAAYDAHMTGIAYMHVIKHKEMELARILSRKGKKGFNPGASAMPNSIQPEENKNPKDLKHQPLILAGQYPQAQMNKMMMDAAGTGRFYHLVPEIHIQTVQSVTEMKEFPTTVHLQFEEGFIIEMDALQISKLFRDYGDFFLYKDTRNSIFMEFFFIDPEKVPSKAVGDLITQLQQRLDLKVVEVYQHRQAPKFRAHNNFDVTK